jgi:hypothetical protein
MSEDNAFIREWGRAHGWDVADTGRIPAGLRSEYATAMSEPMTGGHQDDGSYAFAPRDVSRETIPDPVAEAAGPGPYPEAETGPETERAPGETPPEEPPSKLGRFLKRRGRERPPPKPRRAAGGERRRVSAENLFGYVWAGGAHYFSSRNLGLARMLAFQSPVAGMIIDDSVKGTPVDKIVQPVARLTSGASDLGSLALLAVGAGYVDRHPEAYMMLKPVMMEGMKTWVIVSGPKIREMRRREEAFAEEMRMFGSEFGITLEQMLDDVVLGPREDMAGANGSPS